MAFLARVAALLGTMSPEQLASFWVGAVVADDVGHLARHPILARSPPVWVGGREPFQSLGDRHVEIYPELSFLVLRYDARL